MLFNVSLEDISFKGNLLIMPTYKLPSEHVLNENFMWNILDKKEHKTYLEISHSYRQRTRLCRNKYGFRQHCLRDNFRHVGRGSNNILKAKKKFLFNKIPIF